MLSCMASWSRWSSSGQPPVRPRGRGCLPALRSRRRTISPPANWNVPPLGRLLSETAMVPVPRPHSSLLKEVTVKSPYATSTVVIAVLIGLSGCAAPTSISGQTSTSNCPAGLLTAVQTRIQGFFKGATAALGSESDIQPTTLRPLLKDACITKYTSGKTGDLYTYVFSSSATQEQIGAAATAAGYTGSLTPPLSQYQLAVSGKDPATVTLEPSSFDGTFSTFYPKGVILQTAVPAGN